MISLFWGRQNLVVFLLPKRSYNIDWKVNVYYLRYEGFFFQGQCNIQTAYSTTLIIDKLYLLFLLEFPLYSLAFVLTEFEVFRNYRLNLHEQRFLNGRFQCNRSHSLFFTLCNFLFVWAMITSPRNRSKGYVLQYN